VGSQAIEGPNWKVAYDGYLDLYHLPVLHRESFGTSISNRALYDAWGPHQRVTSPMRSTAGLEAIPESEWQTERLTLGVWTVFPHVSIASFEAGGRMFMVSQLFPGSEVGRSITVQTFLHTGPDAAGQREEVERMMAFLRHVVQDEDYLTGKGIQRALTTGAMSEVLFGRNEAGGQRFHGWVDRLLAASDADLPGLFAGAVPEFAS
jgi:phenylpropionate dioxygenase-like ring-hydroxylating dioxygenase large terminal subunit